MAKKYLVTRDELQQLQYVDPTTILNKLKNVDGSGSGLDADLVRGLPADFTHSLTNNGYQKLPSGLIVQWGLTGSVQPLSDINITFPITFPNAVFSMSTTAYVDGDSQGSVANVITYTKSSASLRNGDPDTPYKGIFWIAIGR